MKLLSLFATISLLLGTLNTYGQNTNSNDIIVEDWGGCEGKAYSPKTVIRFEKNGKQGLMNVKNNKVIVPPLYEYIWTYSEKEQVAIVYSITKKVWFS